MAGKGDLNITNHKDSKISDGNIVIELLRILRPDCFEIERVRSSFSFSLFPNRELSRHEMLENAKYALTVVRQQGAMVYALPEDIVDVNENIMLILFACLMML